MSVLFYDGVDHMIEKITTLIKGKANNSHTHTKNDITDFPTLGTASSKDVASSGNASATQVVIGNDTRLSDARKASDVYTWAKASSKPSYTKSEIGLGNVDNTSDSSKPVSTAQQDAINAAYANANKYTDKKVADLIGSAPETMDTLEEVAAAIQENKDVETALNEAIGKKANQTELDTHTGNSTIHITASERTNWNAAKTHADSAHARTDATKVEKSTTNGNIKINGTETTVYTHPSGTNPHGTTKSDVGLGNVGNFKAVSTVVSQGLTDIEKANARTNIDASKVGHTHTKSQITDFPTKVSSFQNDSNYQTDTDVTNTLTPYATIENLKGSGTIEINGANIATRSIDADKLNIADWSAFGATSSGFIITKDTITMSGETFCTALSSKPLTDKTPYGALVSYRKMSGAGTYYGSYSQISHGILEAGTISGTTATYTPSFQVNGDSVTLEKIDTTLRVATEYGLGASLTDYSLQISPTSGNHMNIGQRTIQAVDKNNTATTLYLNSYGGSVSIGRVNGTGITTLNANVAFEKNCSKVTTSTPNSTNLYGVLMNGGQFVAVVFHGYPISSADPWASIINMNLMSANSKAKDIVLWHNLVTGRGECVCVAFNPHTGNIAVNAQYNNLANDNLSGIAIFPVLQ